MPVTYQSIKTKNYEFYKTRINKTKKLPAFEHSTHKIAQTLNRIMNLLGIFYCRICRREANLQSRY